MKELSELQSIWSANQPPVSDLNENDYLLKITARTARSPSNFFYAAIQWCPVEKRYYAEPVEPNDGNLDPTECWFNDSAMRSLRDTLASLGVHETRRMFNIDDPPVDSHERLRQLFPSLSPKEL